MTKKHFSAARRIWSAVRAVVAEKGRGGARRAMVEGLESRVMLAATPQVVWSTYFGGSRNEEVAPHGLAIDANGNKFIGGWTDSPTLPNSLNSYSTGAPAYVAKFDANGTLLWSRFIRDSGETVGMGVAVDSTGNVYITGDTNANLLDGATNSNHGGKDAFLTKLDSNGTVLWSLYLGGSGDDKAKQVAVDGNGDAYISGYTASSDFAGASGSNGGGEDAFAAKVSAGGVFQWARYIGGSGNDRCGGIAVNAAGEATIAGVTSSSNMANATNVYRGGIGDAFVGKLSAGGAVQWVTYLGGSGDDWGHMGDLAAGVTLDGNGNAFVTGYTASYDLALATNSASGGGDGFLYKVDPAGAAVWSVYIGGAGTDAGVDVTLDGSGRALVVGATNISRSSGIMDGFLAKVNSTGVLKGLVNIGGSGNDYSTSVVLDGNGNTWVGGGTWSGNFPAANNTFHGGDTSQTGEPYEGYLAKVNDFATVYLFNYAPTTYEATASTGGKGQMLLYRTGGDLTQSLTVNYSVGGTAAAGTNYTALSGTATFDPGSPYTFIDVKPIGDGTADPTLTVTGTVTVMTDPNNPYIINSTYKSATVSIIDDAPTTYVWVSSPYVNEGGNLQFSVYRSGSTAQSMTVEYTLGGTAVEGVNYATIPNKQVTFAQGSSSASIVVPTMNDGKATGTLTVNATLVADNVNAPTYHIAPGYTTATGYIMDTAPTVYLWSNLPTAYEGVANSKGQMTVYRTGSVTQPLTLNYTVSGTSNDGVHYQQLSGSVTFAAGRPTATIDVVPVPDNTADPTLPVTVTLDANAAANLVNGYKSATVNIIDDSPTVYLWANKPSAYESGIGNGQMTLYRTGATTQPLTVNYTVSGTANDGVHYQQLTGTATFLANSATATIDVKPVKDGTADNTLPVTVTLLPGNPAVYHTTSAYTTATVNIIDDAPTVYMWTVQPYVYKSGKVDGKIRVYRTGSTANTLTVNYSVLNGSTASEGVNFSMTPKPVVFAAGSAYAYIDLVGVNDPNQNTYLTVIVGLDQGSTYHTLNVYCTATGYILNA